MKTRARWIGSVALLIAGGVASAQTVAPRWNVAAAGAVGDGQADCTAVFQRLLDEAGKAGGGVVEVPAGRFRVAGHLSIPANVTLQGTFRTPPTAPRRAAPQVDGSTLLAFEGRGSTNGAPFIDLAGHNAVVAGLVVMYPEWKQTDVPPVPYPPCVASDDTENTGVLDCLLLNPYEAIRLVRAHRHLVRNVTGYPSWRGLYVDMCGDIGRVENVHFWPFGVHYKPDDPYCQWVNTQGTAFEFARTDWEYVLNTFCFGYGAGYRFSESKDGCANGNFVGLGADSCERAVVVEQAQPPGLLISNGEFVGRWSSREAVCVDIGPDVGGKVSLVNCAFWGPIDRCVRMRGTNGQFTASACHFVNWDNRGVGAPAVQIEAGRAIVQGCTFMEDGLHVEVGPAAVSAILTANQAAGGFRVENAAGARTQAALNEADPVPWTDAARAHYRIAVGVPGDGRHLRGWHGAERGPPPYRWSMARSGLVLPAPAGKACTLELELAVPAHAVGPESGLYLGDARLVPLQAGANLTARLPSATEDRYRLELRCAGWVPKKLNPASQDDRELGVQLRSITLRADDAGPAVFDANTGRPKENGQ